jgi:hypothetical protein
MKVRLTRKLADRINGIDLSEHQVGDTLDLNALEANLILSEGWALPERRTGSSPTDYRRRTGEV